MEYGLGDPPDDTQREPPNPREQGFRKRQQGSSCCSPWLSQHNIPHIHLVFSHQKSHTQAWFDYPKPCLLPQQDRLWLCGGCHSLQSHTVWRLVSEEPGSYPTPCRPRLSICRHRHRSHMLFHGHRLPTPMGNVLHTSWCHYHRQQPLYQG